MRSITLDIITRLLDNTAFVCVHPVGRFSKDFSEVRGLRSGGFQLQVKRWQQYCMRNYEKKCNEAAKIDDERITDIERLTKELCNVAKDHNNVSIRNFVTDSVDYCYTRKLAESVDD